MSDKNDFIDVSICDGKYRVIIKMTGASKVLRHGVEWRDCTGDNLIYGLAYELQKTTKKLKDIKDIINREEP